MADKNIGQLNENSSPTIDDFVAMWDNTGASTGKVSMLNFLSKLVGSTALTVSSQANAGTAGGTMYFINLGGIKLLWAIGASQSIGTTGSAFTFTLPTSFFTTVQGMIGSSAGLTVSANQYHNIESYSTSSVLYDMRSDTPASTQTPAIFMIGT